jgi:hypothetical protein
MIINPYAFGVSYDPDALAFITATGITDNTQKLAINQLVIDLKGYGLWTKCFAIYPFVGGTATTHKYNLKNPADTNAAFRLVFFGGWTHSNTGATGSVNGYANTYNNPSINLIQDSTHVSYYSRTNPVTISGADLGVRGAAGLGGITIISRYTGNLSYYKVNSANATDLTFANIISEGFFMSNRTASNVVNGWKNNTKVITGTTASNGLANQNIVLNAFNDNGSIQLYSPREVAFSTIGNGLNDTESLYLYTAIQTFQTTLGRQV